MRKIFLILATLLLLAGHNCVAQSDSLVLSLQDVIDRANTKSLSSFYAKNKYLVNYWEYRTFKAGRLPSLSMNLTPVQYKDNFVERYDINTNTSVFRQQQSFYTSGGLSLIQNFDLLGGTFFIDSELGLLKNFGDKKFTQYSSVPVRIGYRQNLLGFNRFKWEKKIEPLKYKAAKQELLYNMEQTSEYVVEYYFNLAMAQAEHKLAVENLANSDTLYAIGKERFKIAGIRQDELMTLKLDMVNAKNSLKTSLMKVKRASFALASYIGLDKNTKIEIILPRFPKEVKVTIAKALDLAKSNNFKYTRNKYKALEMERNLKKISLENLLNIRFSASIGFNQVADDFSGAYKAPLQQDVASITLSFPILDWGVGRGRRNVAKSNLEVDRLSSKQDELKLEEDIVMTIGDYNVQQDLISSAREALNLAKFAYEQTRERFIIGKVDLSSLTLAQNRHQKAQTNYISSLKSYWLSHYKLRKLTLYDFEKEEAITIPFEKIR
ncbi:TolC family protein [Marinilabiliaceae bacterium JC040]|nr:TolC family protein [Marinilabiliaceae bacterium JC040]